MMSEDFDNELNDELLSALLDGELPPAEADHVRALIDGSDKLQAEFQSLQTLGSLMSDVGSITPEKAPADFAQSVVSGLTPRTPVRPVAPKSKVLRWSVWSGVGAMVVGAAAVMLILRLGQSPPEPYSVAQNSAPNAVVPDEARRVISAAEMADAMDMSGSIEPEMMPTEMVASQPPATVAASTEPAVFRIETESRDPDMVMAQFLKVMKLNADIDQTDERVAMVVVDLDEADYNRMTGETGLLEGSGLSIRREETRSELHQKLMVMLAMNEPADGPPTKMKKSVRAATAVAGTEKAEPSSKTLPVPGARAGGASRPRVAKTQNDGLNGESAKIASSAVRSSPPKAPSAAPRPSAPASRARSMTIAGAANRKVRVIFFVERPAETADGCDNPA